MDESALEAAYRKWADELVGYAAVLVAPADAPDVVAEAFAQLLRRADTGWSAVHDERRYLFGAVANQARLHHRGAARRRSRLGRLRSSEAPPEQHDQHQSDISVLDSLPRQQRAMVYLAYWEDFTPADIAAALSVTEGSVRKQLARARARLRKELA